MNRNRTYARDGSPTRRNTTTREESGGCKTVPSRRGRGQGQYRSYGTSRGNGVFCLLDDDTLSAFWELL